MSAATASSSPVPRFSPWQASAPESQWYEASDGDLFHASGRADTWAWSAAVEWLPTLTVFVQRLRRAAARLLGFAPGHGRPDRRAGARPASLHRGPRGLYLAACRRAREAGGMELGAARQLFGLDLALLQGIITFLHDALPAFQTVEGPGGAYVLRLDEPRIETRSDGEYRMGLRVTGRLEIGTDPPQLFATFVRLRPEVRADEDGDPVGALAFEAIEEVFPPAAEGPVADTFGADGPLGSALDALTLDVFSDLIASVNDQLNPPGTPVDLAAFSIAFYLGRPAPLPRPVWTIGRVGDHYEPALDLDVSYACVPSLVATVALAGEEPVPPGSPSIVRPGTGLTLVTAAQTFDARFAREAEALRGTELEGLTIDEFRATSTDWGFDIDGRGHKTGADVSFRGSLIGQFRGGVGGQFLMRSTVRTDVDTAWWVDVLSVVALAIPVIGWILGDIFIWEPEAEAPGQVQSSLQDRFVTPISDAAASLANRFQLPLIPTGAFLADVWFFDGNLAIAAAAFAGRRTASVRAVDHDVAHVVKDPAGAGRHSNRRRPVKSVQDIVLDSGHALKPWQAAQLVERGLLSIPGYHVVHNPLATGGVYLRSNPDDTTSNNLLT